jgi:hypothetical protein
MTIFNAISGKPARWIGVVSVSTLAFLALLGGASADPQHSTDRTTNDSALVEWGVKQNGVRTGLSARDEEFSLGKPMLFRLVVENLGSRTVQIETAQAAVNSSMAIERSDGANVPYIAGSVQTGMGRRVLKPGERTVLFADLDIADQYLLTSPGTYKVKFRGQDGGDGSVMIPASNAVTIRVADGPVRPSRLVARNLLDEMQAAGWRLEFVEEGDVVPVGRSSVNGTTVALSHGRRSKDDPFVLIWVTASPSAIKPPERDENRLSPAEALGRCPWGEVYLWSAIVSTEELGTVRKLTASALKIDER